MVNVHKNTIQIPVGELQFNRYYKFQCRRKVKCYVLLNLKKTKQNTLYFASQIY